MIQVRFKLKGAGGSPYVAPITSRYTEEGIILPDGVIISPDMLESLEYMDLEIPTIMRNSMGEGAWDHISYAELLLLFGGDSSEEVLL